MVPELTTEQRREALRKAARARRVRREIKDALKSGMLDPVRGLSMEGAERMRVRDFLKALPGMGGASADLAMRRLEVSPRRRIGGLGCRQMERLIDWIENRGH